MTTLNLNKLGIELSAVGNPASISNPDGTTQNAYINNQNDITPAQYTQAQAILAAHDGQPLGLADCSTTGAKLIGLVGDGVTAFLPTGYVVFCRAYGGAVPTVSMGTNSPNYNNIQAAVALTTFNAVGKFENFNFGFGGVNSAILTQTPVYINVTVAAAGYVLGAVFDGRWFTYQ